MKEKDIINSEKLASINSELFSAFDPGDESFIGGGDTTTTVITTYWEGYFDGLLDTDDSPLPLPLVLAFLGMTALRFDHGRFARYRGRAHLLVQ